MIELRLPRITETDARGQARQINTYLYQLVGDLQWALNDLESKHRVEEVKTEGKQSTSAWHDLGYAEGVEVSDTLVGRGTGGGCRYRTAEEGRHVYIAFNGQFTYNGAAVKINGRSIPKAMRPRGNAISLCMTNTGTIAMVNANPNGEIYVDFPGAESAISVNWIDGYIDYWI